MLKERARELWKLTFDIAEIEHSFKHIWSGNSVYSFARGAVYIGKIPKAIKPS